MTEVSTLESKLQIAEKYFSQKIETPRFFNILFEMNRYFDRQFVRSLHLQLKNKSKINQNERNLLRKYYYYGVGEWLNSVNITYFPQYQATENDKNNVLDSFLTRCETYDKDKIINSVIERYSLLKEKKVLDNSKQWIDWFNKKREQKFDFSLFIYDYSQSDFEADEYSVEAIFRTIADIYDRLENYRHFIFYLHGKLFNKKNEDVTWKILYRIGIYCENFILYKEPFFPFKKQKAIEKLTTFLSARFPKNDNRKLSEDFYSSISTGFKFEDCIVSENQNNIILIMKKIKMDSSAIPCPACMTTIQSGNSFPEMFLRSYECKNPACPERSKSGRGKRFDEFSSYRYFRLVENSELDRIDDALYSAWRRDVFSEKNDVYEMLVRYYAWAGETICTTKSAALQNAAQSSARKIIEYSSNRKAEYETDFENLPIVVLFSKIESLLSSETGTRELKDETELFNEDSTENISSLAAGQIGAAITSPPYYNAREYSSWQNMIMYFVDMMRNAKAVHNVMQENGFYLYNIGDIVNSDNVYVESNMSKKRLQLGFLSCLVFEKVGFNLCGNIIWDKGEVQSKRNSTMNRNSGYVKCINCYEHILVFKKGQENKVVSCVKKITPVIKINSKGENTYKHTAPYPLELVSLLEPFIIKDKYVLEPFLGSGTTLKWCKMNGFKGVGFELNKEYFELARKNIEEEATSAVKKTEQIALF